MSWKQQREPESDLPRAVAPLDRRGNLAASYWGQGELALAGAERCK